MNSFFFFPFCTLFFLFPFNTAQFKIRKNDQFFNFKIFIFFFCIKVRPTKQMSSTKFSPLSPSPLFLPSPENKIQIKKIAS
jgi:hypothetical protein